ncbi:GDSL esterase/lipase At2g42990-like [Tripterygium wilfordii]|uniref:GDSL esterase/lipase At2g42990-like n=1 Tax=Tripterygium wilfordii TaxID=458696 RepID=UPI0018F7F528|nr:GDSL esterase/lipase At2g42990-like [Tripterygium wilfordii]
MAPMYNILWLLLFLSLLVLVPETGAKQPAAANPKIPAIIVFGDSTVDSGNNNYIPTIAKADFRPYGRDFPGGTPTGRFCNGQLPPDFTSEALGLKPIIPAYLDTNYDISDFSTGVCFASAATGYDNVTSELLKVLPLWKEVEYYKEYQTKLRAYLGEEQANKLLREALYLISMGTNDFILNYFLIPIRRSQFTIKQYQNFLIGVARNFLEQLYGLGAQKISFTGIPPMWCLPAERTLNFKESHDCVKELNAVAMEFNVRLKALVAELNKKHPGMKLVLSNPYPILEKIITRPSLYGFEVAELGCCGTGTIEASILCNQHNPLTCTDASKYIFWDSVHPTERANQIISDYLLNNLKQILF